MNGMRTIKHHTAAMGGVVLAIAVLLLAGIAVAQDAADSVGHPGETRITLTEDEAAFLSEHPHIVIAGDASWRPLEYRDASTGQYAGVIAEILRRIEDYTGLTIDVRIYGNYNDALDAVASGEADIVSGLANDELAAHDYQVLLSEPYLTINSAIVGKGHTIDLYGGETHKKIAVVNGDYANDAISSGIGNAELIFCESNEACLSMVMRGEANMAIIASYCAEYYMTVPAYSALHVHTIPDFSWDLAFGISEKAPVALQSILNKGIQMLSGLDMNEAVYEGLVSSAYDNDFLVFLYKHPIPILCGALVILLIIATLLFVIFTSRRAAHQQQLEDGTRLHLALSQTHLCIWELDMETRRITKVDNAQERHGFYDLRENIPESVINEGYIHPDDVPIVRETLTKIRKGEQNVQGCWRVRVDTAPNQASTYWWEKVLFQYIYDDKHRPMKVIGVSEDVTTEKDAQRDSLTLVYNRSSFEQRANQVLNERRNAYLQCAFIILDLDGFKQINDTYGHGMGDRVLISVGAALQSTFRATDIVGRLGGDEFTVFMTSISRTEDAETKAQQLIDNIGRLQEKESYPFPISCSVGVAVATKGKEDLPTLYKKADTALYQAKRSGKNRYTRYQ